MAYIGKTPVIGNFQVCDAISVVNNQAAYTMQVGGVNVSPESANHMLVSLNGILQAPTSSFTVSGSTITFASNLVTGDVIDFIQILGNVLDLGVPSDSTVSLAKLTATGTKDATTFLRGDNTFAEAGGGKVLQVVSTQNITDFSTTSTSFVDVTGATLTITPSSTSSKILLLCNTNTYQNTFQAYYALRWERDIGGSSTAFGDASYGQTYARSAVANDFWGGVGMTYLDSPNTTSAITYTVQASTVGSGTMGFGINSANASNIFAIEIGA
jgi:hypothetical protein